MQKINIYLLIINIISIILMGIDKQLAIKKKNRISEHSLLTLATIGGSIGILLGMIIFRHKIRKKKFLIVVPFLIIFQVFIYIKIPI